MAINKTITVDYQYQNNSIAPTTTSFTGEPVVTNGALVVGHNVRNPGVFSPGTPREGTSSNYTNDANA